MNATQSAILRALELAKILDVEHTEPGLHASFRAVRHELRTLRDIHCPQAETEKAPELASAHTGRATRPGSLRHTILNELSFRPLADFQVRDELARTRPDGPDWPTMSQVRRRRHELMAAGWVEPVQVGDGTRKVRHGDDGRYVTVYQMTDLGGRALLRLRSGQEVLFSDGELGNKSVT